MLTRFLDNWPYKLMAIALAIALRVYVGNTMNPRSTKTMTVPVYLKNVPDNLVPTGWTQNVALEVSGTPSEIDNLEQSDVEATVNLARAHSGPNPALPISVKILGQVDKDSMTPSGAVVYLDTKGTVSLKLHSEFAGTAPEGYEYSEPTISPAFARVDGPQTLLNAIRRLVVFVDVDSNGPSTPTTVDDTDDIVAIDGNNAQVQGVTITPKQAHVIIPIKKASEFKSLVISPLIVGSPKYPLRVSQVDVNPTMMTVSGPGSLLSQTSVILTDPVDLSQQADTFTQSVKLDLPTGLTSLHSPTVQVTVHLTASQPTGTPGGLTTHATPLGKMN
jgi:YbbR domain-containing protein